MLDILLTAAREGLLFGIMAMGVFLTFRVLNFADLTVDGTFALGAATYAAVVISGGSVWLGIALALAGGFAAGAVTGLLHTKAGITGLLSGILTMIALYSINLRIMGRPNIPLLSGQGILGVFEPLGLSPDASAWVVFVLFPGVVFVLLVWLFRTKFGYVLRATGDNIQMVRSLGVNPERMEVWGLALSNALVSLSGALVAQYQGFADVGMGIGTIIAGLASVIIGEVFAGSRGLEWLLVGVFLGTFVYRLSIGLALVLGFEPTDLKLLTAIIVFLALTLPAVRKKVRFS
ncbi:ABC transporter permease [Kyrpidia sp.]|uniref:ABC transporter permease n=1 Tax=Kyrpidia sp. TaxID=2073077 RepID=UPI002586A220|nr:ABC transporter permease [Kyrpidia sp.]MCL6576230.1 ABC transporter permease [Kyrpidia sp.]